MIKGHYIYSVLAVLITILFILPAVLAQSSIDGEFKKLANYAAEYEAGNIGYTQLLIYSSSVRMRMNEIFGAIGKDIGGVLKEEQLKSIFGEPAEETKWVWMEKEEKETKLSKAAPVWKKVVFDGKKIQIRLNAWPFIFGMKEFKGEAENESEISREMKGLEGSLVYRLNFEIEFKRPEEQLNIGARISEIQSLAQAFNLDASPSNAEALAKESVNAERAFESYFRQSGGKCEDLMAGIFGTENRRKSQQMLVQEIAFCEGDNFEVIARLEMCDECEWHWVNLDFWVEGRGPGFKPQESAGGTFSPKSFENMGPAEFQGELRKITEEMKQFCNNRDFNSIMSTKSKVWALNEAWNQKSNNVWNQVDEMFNSQTESMTQQQRQEFDQNYGWIKQEQQKKQKAKELSKTNYDDRKRFYLDLFSGYAKKEYYFTQTEFEKRLVEVFREKGKETCDNNIDDNNNSAVDCDDDQCGGKICGKGTKSMAGENGTIETEVDLYCIEKQCKAKEEIMEIILNVSAVCRELPAIECPAGSRVFFSRYDNESNCPIETSCLKETETCEVNEDCKQPACGMAECVENACKVIELTECKELECADGDEKICEQDGRIVEICTGGFWEKIGECGQAPEIREEIVTGSECLSANDCGADNICNNGVCQVLPQVIIVEPVEAQEESEAAEAETGETGEPQEESAPEIQEEPSQAESQQEGLTLEETSSSPEQPAESSGETGTGQEQPAPEQTSSEPGITGGAIFNFFRTLFSKMRASGAAITGFQTEETASPSPETASPAETPAPEISGESEIEVPEAEMVETTVDGDGEIISRRGEPIEREGEFASTEGGRIENRGPEIFEQEGGESERRKEGVKEDGERRAEENKERCKKECARPCIEKCIRETCGEELECALDEMQKNCEGSCEAEENCIEKCLQGGDWWKEFEVKDEHKEEKGVFQAGGNCRVSQGKTEGFIWFGGWGEPFEQIQPLKNKYYSGGQADWCKYDFENLKKQRQEFESGFNQGFVTWFFEKYLINSAENWEESVSGIYELYWKDVDNAREMAYRMGCLGIGELPPANLINIKYETEFGKIEFWEEIRTAKLPGMDREASIISPYMKVWVFPTKEFLIYEMKKSMANHEFPGSGEDKMDRKNEEGPTAEEKEIIKQDEKFMKQIQTISGKYGGSLDAVVRFVDNGSVVFNLYAQVNEEDIVKIKPMLPEEVSGEDVKIEIEFQKLYDLIFMQEKEMRGGRTENPPWDRKVQPVQIVKDVVNNVRMYFKARDMLDSAKIEPETSQKEVTALMKLFFKMMMKSEKPEPAETEEDMGEEKGIWEEKEKITGEAIAG